MTEKDKDFLEGLAISAACHVLPVRKVFREPIAYSYNGVILPALPEWDREMYPYAYIVAHRISGYEYSYRAGLFLTTVPLYLETKKAILTDAHFSYAKADGECVVYTCGSNDITVNAANLEWVLDPDDDFAGAIVVGKSATWAAGVNEWIWANYNMYGYNDGTLYLAASEPIPIYE